MEAGEDLGDAAVGYSQLPGDVAGPHSQLGQFHDAESDGVGERAAVHENAAELVHFAVTLCLWNLK